jgi:hypothetical protein
MRIFRPKADGTLAPDLDFTLPPGFVLEICAKIKIRIDAFAALRGQDRSGLRLVRFGLLRAVDVLFG